MAAVLCGLAFFNGPSLSAATLTWDGGGSGTGWSLKGNWNPDQALAAGDALVFTGAIRTTTVNDLTANTAIAGITFSGGAATFAISGNAITLAGDIVDQSLNAQTISMAMAMSAGRTVNVASAFGSLTLSGAISGSGARLTKTGSGLLTLGAVNSFNGGVTIGGGTLSISAEGQLGQAPGAATAGHLVIDGGALRITANTTLNANRGIALGSSSGGGGTLDTGGVTLNYNGILTNNGGTNSLTKTGLGTLVLGGVSTYTGATTVNQGTLRLDFTQLAGTSSNIINSSSALVMGGLSTVLGNANAAQTGSMQPGATLNVTSKSASNSSQAFSSLTLNAGYSTLSTTQTSSGNVLLALGAITRNQGGVVNFSLAGTLSAANAITTTTVNANGILGGWAVYGNGAGYAANDGGNNIIAYGGYTDIAASGAAIADNAASNVRINSGTAGTITLSGTPMTVNINTLQQNTNVATTLSLAAGDILRVGTSGGIMVTSAAGTTGSLVIGNVSSQGRLTAGGNTEGTAGEITLLDYNTATAGAGITINAVIANNNSSTGAANSAGAGVVSLTIFGNQGSGGNAVIITGNNTFSGGTVINQGRVQVTNANAFGTGAVTVLSGAQAWLNAAGTYTNEFLIAGSGYASQFDTPGAIRMTTSNTVLSGKITLLNDAAINIRNTGGHSITGRITGGYNLTLTGTSSNANSNVTLSSLSNDWTGNLFIDGVRVILGASGVLPNGAGKGNVVISNSGFAILDLNGNSETINGLASLGANGFVQNNAGSTTSTLTVGDGDATSTFSGVIRNNSGTGGTLALTKTGTGTQVLAGVNSYTGATTVEGGTLLVTGTLNGATAGAVTVQNGGTLALGGGTVNGVVTVQSGGVLSGVSTTTTTGTLNGALSVAGGGSINLVNGVAGTLALAGGLTLGDGASSALWMDLGGVGTTSDVIGLGASTLTVNAGGVVVFLNNLGSLALGETYTLLNFAAGAGDGFVIGSGTTVGGISLDAGSINLGFNTATLNVTSTSVQVTIGGSATPTTAYWTGALGSTWNARSGLNGNWTTDAAGTVNAQQIPGTTTDVHFAADGATNLTSTLGQDFSIKSLTFRSGTGAVTVGGTSTLTLGSGGITVEAGAGAATLSTAILSLGANQVWTNSSGNNLTVSSIISGSGTLTTHGSVLISGVNTYNGGTTVASGTLQITNASSLGSGSVSIAAGAFLNVNIGGNILNSAISGAGTVTVTPNGETRLRGVMSAFTGAVNITGNGNAKTNIDSTVVSINSAATINIASGGTLFVAGAGVNVAAGINVTGTGNNENLGALRVDSNAIVSGTVTLTGNATVGGGPGLTGTISGVIGDSGLGYSLTKVGTSTMILSGANTFGGDTNVSAGILRLAHSLALQGSTLASAGVVFDQSVADHQFTFGGLTGSMSLSLQDNATTPNAVTLSAGANDQDTVFSGTLGGSGSFNKIGDGMMEFATGQNHTGGTNVLAGTLLITNTSGSATGTGDTVVAAGGRLAGNGFAGSTSATSNITVSSGGILNVGLPGGSVGDSLNLSTGGAGVITFAGTLQFDLFDSLDGTADQTEGDTLFLTSDSTVVLGGSLNVTDYFSLGDFWQEGDSWKLLDWSAVTATTKSSGDFSTLVMPELDPAYKWLTSMTGEGYFITIVAVPEPGRMVLLAAGLAGMLLRRRRTTRRTSDVQ